MRIWSDIVVIELQETILFHTVVISSLIAGYIKLVDHGLILSCHHVGYKRTWSYWSVWSYTGAWSCTPDYTVYMGLSSH
jgi:hypothetical protein